MAKTYSQYKVLSGSLFKHLDTTRELKFTFTDPDTGYPIRPHGQHKYVAKIANSTGYIGDRPVSVLGSTFTVKTSDLKDLAVGDYTLEVWETYTDSEGNEQTGIYPSPTSFVPFSISSNVSDKTGEQIKRIGFQDVVDQAVMNIGMNYVFQVNTIEPDQNATVVQSAADGKNYVTFNIPRGKTGEQGFRGPAGKNFQIKQTFDSIKAMTDSQGNGFDDGDFALIASNTQDPDNSKLYVWHADKKQFVYMNDLSGAQGIQGPVGPAPTLHVTKVTTVPNGEQPSFTATPVGNGNYNIEIGLPKGDKGDTGSRGYNVWAMKMAVGGSVSGRSITDLYNASASNLPEVDDLVVQPDGNVYQVTAVSNTDDGSNGGGTFNLGSAIFSIKGDKGDDAVINVISQAEYDALTDKSGVYFIEG